jgi:hypothetical protein
VDLLKLATPTSVNAASAPMSACAAVDARKGLRAAAGIKAAVRVADAQKLTQWPMVAQNYHCLCC